jgi:hypothetical protein
MSRLSDLAEAVGCTYPSQGDYCKKHHSVLLEYAAEAVLNGREPDYAAARRTFDELYYANPTQLGLVLSQTVDAALGGKHVRIIDLEGGTE